MRCRAPASLAPDTTWPPSCPAAQLAFGILIAAQEAGQWVGNAVLGSCASGFGGGLALIMFALAISHRPNTPPTVSLVLAGFWLLVWRAAVQPTSSPNRRAMHD